MSSNRKHTGRGVSLSGEMLAAVDKRIAGLKPWVNGFSSYVQRLIYLDLERKVINDDGGVNEDAVKPATKGTKRPFEARPGPAILLTNYQELVTAESALEFWRIRP